MASPPPDPIATENGSPLFAFVAFTEPITFVGTTVGTLIDMYRAGVHVANEGAFPGIGGLRVFHTLDPGNVDRIVYRQPDPLDVDQHFGTTDGSFVGQFALPVPLVLVP